MKPEQFAYWLQGFVELTGGMVPTAEQWAQIVAHLKTVFFKITPPLEPIPPFTPTTEPPVDYTIPRFRPNREWPTAPTIIC